MSSTTNAIFRASRPLLRQQQAMGAAFTRATPAQRVGTAQRFTFRSSNYYQQGGRRWQSTGGAAGEQQQAQSWFKKMWESEVGIKTVHFWAPVMKWALVIAGISDLARPAEKLSLTQNLALTCTGLIWTRWCFIIRPKNILLATVNFFLAIVGIMQVTRITMYHYGQKDAAAAVTDVKDDLKKEAAAVKEEVKEAAKAVKP